MDQNKENVKYIEYDINRTELVKRRKTVLVPREYDETKVVDFLKNLVEGGHLDLSKAYIDSVDIEELDVSSRGERVLSPRRSKYLLASEVIVPYSRPKVFEGTSEEKFEINSI